MGVAIAWSRQAAKHKTLARRNKTSRETRDKNKNKNTGEAAIKTTHSTHKRCTKIYQTQTNESSEELLSLRPLIKKKREEKRTLSSLCS